MKIYVLLTIVQLNTSVSVGVLDAYTHEADCEQTKRWLEQRHPSEGPLKKTFKCEDARLWMPDTRSQRPEWRHRLEPQPDNRAPRKEPQTAVPPKPLSWGGTWFGGSITFETKP